MWLLQLRRRAIEIDGAKNVENLHRHVVVAACFGESDRTIGHGRDALVVGARQQYRDAYAKGKSRIPRIAAAFETIYQVINEGGRGRIAPLEIGELGTPRRDAKAEALGRAVRRRGLAGGV
jgi:hypothetical protein